MRTIPISLIVFWIIIIVFPEIIAYLIGSVFIIIWINILIFSKSFKSWKEEYVKFGKYKIYR